MLMLMLMADLLLADADLFVFVLCFFVKMWRCLPVVLGGYRHLSPPSQIEAPRSSEFDGRFDEVVRRTT
jgi:hypothetical protein